MSGNNLDNHGEFLNSIVPKLLSYGYAINESIGGIFECAEGQERHQRNMEFEYTCFFQTFMTTDYLVTVFMFKKFIKTYKKVLSDKVIAHMIFYTHYPSALANKQMAQNINRIAELLNNMVDNNKIKFSSIHELFMNYNNYYLQYEDSYQIKEFEAVFNEQSKNIKIENLINDYNKSGISKFMQDIIVETIRDINPKYAISPEGSPLKDNRQGDLSIIQDFMEMDTNYLYAEHNKTVF